MMTDTSTRIALSGPIAASAADQPFAGAASPVGLNDPAISDLLPPHDYLEEEYFVAGEIDGQPYMTTLLVRRPRDPARFSGLVALETVHVQGALGFWQTAHPVILDGGHMWVAVGSQLGGVEGVIKPFNPARYEGLRVPSAPSSEQVMAALRQWEQSADASAPPDLFAVDTVSNAIMTQVGALLKTGLDGTPLAGFTAETLIMGGASQTGMATLNYIQAANAAARLPDGRPVYDGFLPMATPGYAPVKGGDAAVIHPFVEGDLPLFGAIGPNGYGAARPDSDAADDRYRSYQIPGGSHLPTRGLRDAAGIPHFGISLAPGERLIQFPAAPFYRAAFVNLVDWLTKGIAPPHAPAIEIVGGAIATDAFGNALGGVRSPYVDVPSVRYQPARFLRSLIGAEIPFSPEQLQGLYGSREDYLRRFGAAMDLAVAERWILPGDGETLKAEEGDQPPF